MLLVLRYIVFGSFNFLFHFLANFSELPKFQQENLVGDLLKLSFLCDGWMDSGEKRNTESTSELLKHFNRGKVKNLQLVKCSNINLYFWGLVFWRSCLYIGGPTSQEVTGHLLLRQSSEEMFSFSLLMFIAFTFSLSALRLTQLFRAWC